MARARIRDLKNAKWIDICQSEWYVRNQSDTAWSRITPAQGLKIRHGTNNYWLDIDCLSEDECGDDQYGGTPDGTGENGSSKPTNPNLPGDTGYPGETDGTGTNPGTYNPWDPNTVSPPYVPPVTPGPNNGNNSPNNPDYNDPDADSSDEGNGDDSCAQGTYSNGSYPPGYDLPDGCGPDSGLGTDDNGNPVINRPGLGDKESYDDENGEGTGEGDGSEDNAYVCPTTVSSNGKQITEFYIEMGATPGQVDFEYDAYQGLAGFVIYYAGQKIAESGRTSGAGRLSVQYAPVPGDTKVFVRARTAGDNIGWTFRAPCPGTEDEIGTITNPAPCLGTFEPGNGGGKFTEVVHAMGTNPGVVEIEYQMWNVPDTLTVYYGNTVLASTNGPASGEGSLTFNYAPANGNDKITVRIVSSTNATSWAYKISCPGTDGTKSDPKPCDPDTPTSSGGAGVTDLYFDMGSVAGTAQVHYQAWNLPDTFEVYQGATLLATTGEVAGEGYLPFAYNPAGGDVRVRVSGDGQTTWAFVMECPVAPTAPVDCNTLFTSDGAVKNTIVNLPGASNTSFAYIEYATVAATIDPPAGAADTLVVDYDAVVVENTGSVLRYADKGFGALVIPMKAGVNSMAVDVTSTSWWQHTTYCPAVYQPVVGMSQFMKGVPHVYESTDYYSAVGPTSKQIASTSNLESKTLGCQVLMSMFRSSGGTCTFTGFADNYCYLYIQAANSSSVTEIGPFVFPSVGVFNVSLPAGTYFITAILEETDAASPSVLALKIENGGKIVNVTTKDWYGAYFEDGLSFGSNNPILGAVTARIFDTDAQATAYMGATGAPSPASIFNTWHRFDGPSYYNDRVDAEANAPGTGAATWQYNNGTQSFEQQANVSQPNGIVSPSKYSSYTFEATIQSNDSDDDTNGLIIAYDGRYDGNNVWQNKSLVVARSGGGVAPFGGYGLLFVHNGSVSQLQAFTPPSTINSWAGRYTRIRVSRSGTSFTFNVSDWNSTAPGTNYTVDIAGNPQLTELTAASSIGFYTHSQAQSRFYDVVAPGLGGEPVFAYDTGKIWEYGSGAWNLLGSNQSFSSKLGNYKLATSSANGNKYLIYRKIQRKV